MQAQDDSHMGQIPINASYLNLSWHILECSPINSSIKLWTTLGEDASGDKDLLFFLTLSNLTLTWLVQENHRKDLLKLHHSIINLEDLLLAKLTAYKPNLCPNASLTLKSQVQPQRLRAGRKEK